MDLARIEASLTAARDELLAYWEQPEGQACLLVLRVAADALADYRAVDAATARRADPEGWQRIEALAGEIRRLRAPLESAT